VKIAVLGAGNMGSWIARELMRDNDVIVYDIDRSKAEKIQEAKQLNSMSELKSFAPDMLINAVSLQNTVEAFEKAVPYLSRECILTDLASVKGEIPAYYKKNHFPSVSVHPMFGPTFVNVERLENENVVIIKESDPRGAEFFRDFFKSLGLNLFEYSFDEHDKMIAYSLTLPFASTMVFSACMKNTTVPGTTFKKHKEIALGLLFEDDYLLSEILFNPYSLVQLEKVTNRLEFLKHVIEEKDFDEAKKFFDRLRNNVS